MPYVVGIDLGTTNCSVAYADAGPDADGQVHGLPIPQVVAPGEVAEVAGLPSFLLLAGAHEVAPESLALPWDASPNGAVGTLARDRGAELPHRLVASAKSWLCHAGVDREAPILPWKTVASESEAGDGEQVSPVEASARYLAHIRAAWNHAFPGDPLEDQEVLLTVPASFDAIARELTVAAARLAGLTNITLLEEPQAAFYAYLCQAGDDWREALSAGDVVLVCDIGGGTTDFSLIAVTDEGGNLGLERIAVGDHILLGGDNMDLALAHRLAQRLAEKGKSLSAMQTRALVHACRRAKEQLLSADAPESLPISILGRGSKLIGGTIRTELSRLDVETLLIDGFFPEVAAEARPEGPGSPSTGGKRRATGLRTLGLPYASDPGITRHLAEFLARNSQRPTVILWNGGVMKGDRLRRRVADLLAAWHQRPKLPSLTGTDLDLAVSRGAAYYGLVRHGRGIRIRGGTARAYYIGVEAATPAIPGFAPPVVGLCVAPFGMEEGTAVDVPGEKLGLVVGETAVFRFFASTTRKEDGPGGVAEIIADGDPIELLPVEATLDAGDGHEPGDLVPVTLQSEVTEVGTLNLWCVAEGSGHRWKLEYSLREKEDA